MALRATGIPDPNFAYLDSVVDWRRESSRNGILWLGTAGGIFEKRYVALMPALRWLPVPGANLHDARRGHAPTVDLTVEVPAGWLVAGPGRREMLGEGRYRFRPPARGPGGRALRRALPPPGHGSRRCRIRTASPPGSSAQSRLLRGRARTREIAVGTDSSRRRRISESPIRTRASASSRFPRTCAPTAADIGSIRGWRCQACCC